MQAEAQEYIATCDCPDYLKKAEKRLSEESERVAQYLDPSTETKITEVVETELVQKQVWPMFMHLVYDCVKVASVHLHCLWLVEYTTNLQDDETGEVLACAVLLAWAGQYRPKERARAVNGERMLQMMIPEVHKSI